MVIYVFFFLWGSFFFWAGVGLLMIINGDQLWLLVRELLSSNLTISYHKSTLSFYFVDLPKHTELQNCDFPVRYVSLPKAYVCCFWEWWVEPKSELNGLIWINCNDLTATSLESWLIREIIPK